MSRPTSSRSRASSRAHQPFLGAAFRPRTAHGGAIRTGRRKLSRPIDPKRAMHTVFRSSLAKGELSFLHPRRVRLVDQVVRDAAAYYGIRLYQYANSGTHLHLLFKGSSRKAIQDFLRAVGSRVAQLVTGARKGQAFGRFWDSLAYSRVVEWGCAFVGVRFFVLRNQLEAEGIAEYERLSPAEQVRRRRQRTKAEPMPFPAEWES